jgi:hypothetical protein
MEKEGRPDGRRPHGCESLLEYHRQRLDRYKQLNGVEIGFELSAEQCKALREEAVMYYYRYLSLFIMGQYHHVVQDTQRNLQVFDLCHKFAARKSDRLALEQYRPYVLMMNTRARAQLAIEGARLREAAEICRQGIDGITEFFKRISRPELAEHCSELIILRNLSEDVRKKLPVDPSEALHADLVQALEREQYEKAAELRDKLRSLDPTQAPSPHKESDA